MSDFYIFKIDSDNDLLMVSHSRYWSEFDGQYGKSENQTLLSQLDKYGFEFQPIKHNRDIIYNQFRNYINQSTYTVNFKFNNQNIAHDFIYLTKDEWTQWSLQKTECPDDKSQNSSLDVPCTAKSWMEWFGFR